jgi:hypothetical protein
MSANSILAVVMLLLVGFDVGFTALWQHFAPGDRNPIVDWMLRKLGNWTWCIILPVVGVFVVLLGMVQWWGVTVVLAFMIGLEGYIVFDEFRKIFAVIPPMDKG